MRPSALARPLIIVITRQRQSTLGFLPPFCNEVSLSHPGFAETDQAAMRPLTSSGQAGFEPAKPKGQRLAAGHKRLEEGWRVKTRCDRRWS